MRTKILKIAEEQMKAGGYTSLSFGAIAKELSTTRANLHYHFKNKESLAVEVTKRFIADQESDLVKMAAQFTGNFPKYLEGMESFLWSHHDCNGRVGACVCAQIIRQPQVPDSLMSLAQRHFDFMRNMLTEQVVESQKNGTLRNDVDPLVIAMQAGCVMTGMAQMALFMSEDICSGNYPLKGTLKEWVKNYLPL